jgi:multisubunit Na+/H+ antiporter MnhB subunit
LDRPGQRHERRAAGGRADRDGDRQGRAIAFLIIAAGLCVLARLERSPGLAVVAALHAGAAVLAAAYNVENLVFRLGWSPRGDQWRYTDLPNVLLPALVLLVGGAIAAAVPLRKRT